MRKKISQQQARLLQRRVIELEAVLDGQKNRWREDWSPGWVNIWNLTVSEDTFARVSTARLLGHAVIVVPAGSDTVRFYAERLGVK